VGSEQEESDGWLPTQAVCEKGVGGVRRVERKRQAADECGQGANQPPQESVELQAVGRNHGEPENIDSWQAPKGPPQSGEEQDPYTLNGAAVAAKIEEVGGRRARQSLGRGLDGCRDQGVVILLQTKRTAEPEMSNPCQARQEQIGLDLGHPPSSG